MSSTRFETPLRVTPKTSWLLAALLTGGHLSALATLPYMALPGWIMIVIALIVGISLYRSIYTHVLLKGSRAVRALVWEASGEILVLDGKGRQYQAALAPGSFAHPWAVIINLKPKGRLKRALVLMPDSVAVDILRQLRMRLRLASRVGWVT